MSHLIGKSWFKQKKKKKTFFNIWNNFAFHLLFQAYFDVFAGKTDEIKWLIKKLIFALVSAH